MKLQTLKQVKTIVLNRKKLKLNSLCCHMLLTNLIGLMNVKEGSQLLPFAFSCQSPFWDSVPDGYVKKKKVINPNGLQGNELCT